MDLLPQVLCSTPSLYARPNTSHLLQCRQGRGKLDLREIEVSHVTHEQRGISGITGSMSFAFIS